jgi:antitoxin component of RelBE/YafQ-DinJ toxin-antitoxin module
MTAPIQSQKIRSNVYLDVDLKAQAKEIFKSYGLSFSDGLNLLLKQATDKKSPILISDLDIEPVYSDDPDYKSMQEARKGDTISLDEFMKL